MRRSGRRQPSSASMGTIICAGTVSSRAATHTRPAYRCDCGTRCRAHTSNDAVEGKGVDQWLIATTAQLAFAAMLSVLTQRAPTTAQLAFAALLSVLTERAPTTAQLASAALLSVLTERAPTTAQLAVATAHKMLTKRAPTTALRARAVRLSVHAVVGLNPTTLGVHAPAFHPLTHNVIDQLLPRAASILLLEALGARALSLAMPAHHLVLNLKQIEWDAVRAERQNGVESKSSPSPTAILALARYIPDISSGPLPNAARQAWARLAQCASLSERGMGVPLESDPQTQQPQASP
jgi:hypothetical protein